MKTILIKFENKLWLTNDLNVAFITFVFDWHVKHVKRIRPWDSFGMLKKFYASKYLCWYGMIDLSFILMFRNTSPFLMVLEILKWLDCVICEAVIFEVWLVISMSISNESQSYLTMFTIMNSFIYAQFS